MHKLYFSNKVDQKPYSLEHRMETCGEVLMVVVAGKRVQSLKKWQEFIRIR
jgi:hypothetical protein